jgi:hypothetical protein
MRLPIVLVTAFVVAAGAAAARDLGPRPPTIVGDAARARIDALLARYDPDYPLQHARNEARLDRLGAELFERTLAGLDTRCSQQIFVEAKWLVGYTAWWPRIDARLDELENSFAIADQAFAAEPYYKDGFYGRCAVEAFIRLEATIERYFVFADRGELPPTAHGPIAAVGHEPTIVDELAALLRSDPARLGEDNRSRLGGLVGILATGARERAAVELWRATARDGAIPADAMAARIAELNRFIDAWQDPETGYWGAWYRDGEDGFATSDLSITYHIVKARRGEVAHWPQLVATTLAIRDDAYPFGWLSDGRWTNHNNYDLVRLFEYAWPHLDDGQRVELGALMQDMLDWSFASSIDESFAGFKFQPELSSSVGAELYFGVAFLDAVGYFDAAPWHGGLARPAPAAPVCARLIDHAARLDEDDTYVVGALAKLDRACAAHLDR